MEIEILATCDHPYIVKLLGAYYYDGKLCLPRKSHGQRSLWVTVSGVTKSQTQLGG